MVPECQPRDPAATGRDSRRTRTIVSAAGPPQPRIHARAALTGPGAESILSPFSAVLFLLLEGSCTGKSSSRSTTRSIRIGPSTAPSSCALATGGRITGNHVYAARLHDVRFRQLETGLPAQFQTPDEIKRQRKIHDKLIEKGLQLIADSFLDQVGKRCDKAGVPLTRQLLEGINYEEIVSEVNRGEGRLPGLIGFDPNRAKGYDGGEHGRGDVQLGADGRIVAEDEDAAARLVGTSGRQYDLLVIGAHGLGRQPYSQLGGVVARALRGIEKDMLIVRDDQPLEGGRFMVCVDGSSYSYRAMKMALELAQEFGASLYVCSAFDVEYHHVVFNNIKDVLSVQASKVFKFEEQEELHNNIIDKGLLKLCQANLKRAEVMAQEYPGRPDQDADPHRQAVPGHPAVGRGDQADAARSPRRHGAHRIDGTELGSQAENLIRLAPCNLLLTGTVGIRPEDIPWIEEDGKAGLPWAPDAEVRILRVPPFAQGIARRAVEEFVLEQTAGDHRHQQAARRGDRASCCRRTCS